jgi:hypothetical protein
MISGNISASSVANAAGALACAIGSHQPNATDHHLRSSLAQAGGFDVGPGLLRTVEGNLMDVEPVTLGQRRRHARFDLWGKPWKDGHSCSDKRSNGEN